MIRGPREEWDVVVVGAGAAGVGLGCALAHVGCERFLLLDRYDVGASFAGWPAEMRFITPSFSTNSIGMLDLNSVAVGTSPAHTLQPPPGGFGRALVGDLPKPMVRSRGPF
jgi:putative flavoprotein involved in K+ transport